jgi:hypothetical protein
VEPDTDPQVTSEVFYRLQLTDNLQITPALQVTHNPSFNDVKDTLYVGSVLRMRLAFWPSMGTPWSGRPAAVPSSLSRR